MLRRQRIEREIDRRGVPTTVNKQPPIKAMWAKAQPSRVQMFLGDTIDQQAAYEVLFPAYALDPPYSIKNKMKILRGRVNWTGTIRHVDPIDDGDEIVAVTCIVEITSQ